MIDRPSIERTLDRIETGIREIDIAYEKYFMGIEKRPPEKQRDDLGKLLRQLSNGYIPQVDLRFRYQSVATRFHSYCGNWDRLMRNIEEGKFVRQLQKIRSSSSPAPTLTAAIPSARSEADRIHEQLMAFGGNVDRQQVATFLEKQRAALKEKLGGREVEFIVVTEDGKPKIKARPKA